MTKKYLWLPLVAIGLVFNSFTISNHTNNTFFNTLNHYKSTQYNPTTTTNECAIPDGKDGEKGKKTTTTAQKKKITATKNSPIEIKKTPKVNNNTYFKTSLISSSKPTLSTLVATQRPQAQQPQIQKIANYAVQGSTFSNVTAGYVSSTNKGHTYLNTDSYYSLRRDIETNYKNLSQNYQNATSSYEKDLIIADATQFFTHALADYLLPQWYGTPWNFYGHTEYPRSGTIACGYLVSTALSHLGVNVNRCTLAQQWPVNMLKTLTPYNMTFAGGKNQALQTIQNQGYGIYVIGTENHVGFLHYNEQGMRFIHSSYSGSKRVTAEEPEYSVGFLHTTYYYIGKITTPEFITKWLTNEKFIVVKG